MSSRNMTIPSRPAPPPPQTISNKTNRYSPATNWNDTPFSPQHSIGTNSSRQQTQLTVNQTGIKPRKTPPPRPPPPKVIPALKKPGQPQSINILSNLFGQKRNHSGSKTPVSLQKGQIPMKLPPPPKQPPPLNHHGANYGSISSVTQHSNHGSTNGADQQLISFDSPPSSPTFTQKSCSDCISVDSFSSDSNYSSPNNGSVSQTESGFEDDFVVSQGDHHRSKASTPSAMKDLWDLSDPFGMPPVGAKPSASSGNSHSIYAPLSSATIRAPAVNSKLYEAEFVDPLCNGKTVVPKVQTVAKPTIIKASTAASGGSQKSTPVHSLKTRVPVPTQQLPSWASTKPPLVVPTIYFPESSSGNSSFGDADEPLDSLPSLPMPNIPPPPPPPCVNTDDLAALTIGNHHQQQEEAYGIALYDFNGETDEDLSFRANDKIYLVRRMDEEWLYGRDRRGCEGMFPTNFIEIKVPLQDERTLHTSDSNSNKSKAAVTSESISHPKVRVMYTFNAETVDDLTIMENEYVTVLYQITPEWLYGEMHGRQGQFPANYIQYVPANLPPMPATKNGSIQAAE
ncbi:SH3 domain-containing protein 19 isoform X2 [Toxorhynchites rutilus septentrionalis]|uniref:SH3 domain-containing protein 19 isoform X2 n=1 Tax=Toxorhynchites rutilus septentrionalis TaxID=329112 RepID=UPI00247AB765|nr:SH3 domain-containing protein 19 isoform X2 [Toxorhynchites rutilus septentrionalis]